MLKGNCHISMWENKCEKMWTYTFHKRKNKCLQFICSLDLDDDDKDGGGKGNGHGNDDDDERDDENNRNDPGVGSGECGDGKMINH